MDDDDRVFCLWRADFDREINALVYGMDLFSRQRSGLWRRSREEHVEYAHSIDFLAELFASKGFSDFSAVEEEDRLFLQCRRSSDAS